MTDGTEAISFGTDGWRAPLSEFTAARVRMVGQAVATHLSAESNGGPVAVGYDARETSRGFAEELADVLAANGLDVTIADRDCPTPVLAWTVAEGSFTGGLMITASHNPPEYNGVKFVPADGAPALPPVTDDLEERLEPPETGATTGESVTERDLLDPYLDYARRFVDTDLSGLTVAYDAMHGSGRGVTDHLLSTAGATVERFRCTRDPTFGGTPPEPGPERVADLRERVEGGPAALGIINDGDADRFGLVTPDRGYLDPNLLLAVLYEYLLERDDGDVVRTVSTSSLVDRVADAHGHRTHETAVGFKWVAAAMGRNPTLAGGEESGGYGVTAHLRNKDGVLVALLAAAAHTDEPVDERTERLLDEYGQVFQDRTSVDCPEPRKAAVLEELDAALPSEIAGTAVAETNRLDGFKLVLADGSWLLVRPSGTEPKLRVYAEGESESRVEELLAAGRELVSTHLNE
ncbi:MAG: phosphoglucomutase/phosphomannomutase family protein [Halovenus sp.]